MGSMLLFVLVAVLLFQTPAPAPSVEPPTEIAPSMFLFRYPPMPGRGPDGNTIIFNAPDGLIVVDTGRHTMVTDSILAFARERKRPIVAIINTHWHLDHVSGNGRLKAEYPKARVYTTTAVDRALAPGGFLARNLDQVKTMPPPADQVRRDEVNIFVTTMDKGSDLRPDVPLTKSAAMRLAGKPLDVHVTDKAVSDADVWLFDKTSRVAVIGDLVTVPVPYFESACPDKWKAALDEVWGTPFETAVPGHGRPMTRTQFDAYRRSFGEFVSCARSGKDAAACGTAWADGIGSALLDDDPARKRAVASGIEYYVGYLRSNGGKAPDCLAQ